MMPHAVWRIKKGEDRRFRSGHPWVYSNELQESPKGLLPGAPVELQDAGGAFLARGYGNPASLIAFRALSRNPEITDPTGLESLQKTLERAWLLREQLGLTQASFRLCFGEADFLPGLIIDRYLLTDQQQLFVVQAHTAGADRLLEHLPKALESPVRTFGNLPAAILIKNDVGARKMEGLEEQPARLIPPSDPKNAQNNEDLRSRSFLTRSVTGSPLEFTTDFPEGQKTGFFLDQLDNTLLAARALTPLLRRWSASGKPVKILDLCCYVGQWGTQLGHLLSSLGIRAEITAMDASQSALEFARKNVTRTGASFTALRGDVLEDMEQLMAADFDLVISDPPAFIKGRKSIPTGTHAYLQLNTQALRVLKPGGALISCSCSALLEESSFVEVLAKAARRNRTTVQWIARGGQALDHPVLAEFPEGRYLKCWIGIRSSS